MPFKYIFPIIIAVVSWSQVTAQEPRLSQLEQKYQYYHDRFETRFISVGEAPGQSMPITTYQCDCWCNSPRVQQYEVAGKSRRSVQSLPFYADTAWVCGLYKDKISTKSGNIELEPAECGITMQSPDKRFEGEAGGIIDLADQQGWGDYISYLATSYALLDKNNSPDALRNKQKIAKDILLALSAIPRIILKGYQLFDQMPPPDSYKAWFIRNDGEADFWKNFQHLDDTPWPVRCVSGPYACFDPNNLEGMIAKLKFTSQDQMVAIIWGLAFVKRFIPAELEVEGITIVGFAQQLAKDMLQQLYKAGWRIETPDGKLLGTAVGGAVMAYGYGFDKCGEFIYGKLLGKYKGLPSVGDNFYRGLWRRAVGRWGPAWNNVMYLGLASIGNARSLDWTYEVSMEEGRYIYPLMQALLHQQKLKPVQAEILRESLYQALLQAPSEGPCYPAMDNSWCNCSPAKGWMTLNRWTTPHLEHRNGEGSGLHLGQFNGLDFLLAYNLYQLYYGVD